MKKTFASLFVLFAAALPAFCASTCETRVDRHQDATTRQRVAHCLTPEPEQPAPAGPELVYYGVSSNKPTEADPETTKRKKQTYFDKEGVQVSSDFVDTRNFPVFANETLSEQDRIALEEAQKKQILEETKKQQQLQETQANAAVAEKKEKTARAPRRLDTPAPTEVVSADSSETVSAPVASSQTNKPTSSANENTEEKGSSKMSKPYTEMVESAVLSPYSEHEYPGEFESRPVPVLESVSKDNSTKEDASEETINEGEKIVGEESAEETVPNDFATETTEEEPVNKAAQEEPVLEEPQVDPEQAAVYAALAEKLGYESRQQKPKRVMKEIAPQSQEVTPASQTVQTYNDVQPVDTMPTDTPPAEIAQAQALENNPVSLPDPSAYSMPENFMEDDLLTGNESFGYNATDPAMQL